jgi:hypothetical protein
MASKGSGRARRSAAWLCGLLLLLAALPATAREVEGFRFDDEIRLAGAPLQLNGIGLRAITVLKAYAAALYLERKATTPAQVLAMPGPKRLRLRMMVEVSSAEFSKALHKGVARNVPAADQPRLAERVQRFGAAIDAIGLLRKGDTVDLDYIPDSGLVMTVNGTRRGAPLPGGDLYDALLLTFIGERPTDKELKAGLLGGPPI